MKTDHTRRNLLITLLLVLVVIAGLVLTSGTRSILSAKIQINAVPNDSTVTVDGKKVPLAKQVAIGAGTHKIKVSREGFASQTQSFSVKIRDKKLLQFYLNPNSDVGIQWLSLHPFQAFQIEGKASRDFDKIASENTSENPITEQLPQYGTNYNITYGQSIKEPNNSNAVAIFIQADSPFARQQALSQIRDMGFDPTDLEIVFTRPQE